MRLLLCTILIVISGAIVAGQSAPVPDRDNNLNSVRLDRTALDSLPTLDADPLPALAPLSSTYNRRNKTRARA